MAWANWETLIVNTNGDILHDDFTKGKLELSGSAVLSIYKNVVFLDDPKAWHDGQGFQEPTILEIEQGRLCYADADIYVKASKHQNAVFVFVALYVKEEDSDNYRMEFKGGIGCNGSLDLIDYAKKYNPDWAKDIPWDKLKKSRVLEFSGVNDKFDTTWGFTIFSNRANVNVELGVGCRPNTCVGVGKDTLKSYVAWLKKLSYSYKHHHINKWIKEVEKSVQTKKHYEPNIELELANK
jgi:hypothetical protein